MDIKLSERWRWGSFEESVEICDNLRCPINNEERQKRITGKDISELFPYYGATGQVGLIDGYLTDGEYVLLGEDGAPFLNSYATKAYIIQGKTWVNNHAHILRSKTNNRFLCYFLNHIEYKKFVTGTTRLKLTQAAMKTIKIPIAPAEEQELIVAKIEELFSELDKGIEAMQKMKELLKIYRQAVLKDAFEGLFLHNTTDILGNHLIDIQAGKSFRCLEVPPSDNEYGVVKVSSVTWGEYDENESKTCTRKDMYNENYLIKNGDFLFSRANTIQLVGTCVIVKKITKKIMLSDKILRFVLKVDLLKEYLLYFLRSGYGRNQIEHLSTGNQESMRNIGQTQIKEIRIPLCSIKEQERVIREIESNLSVCENFLQTVDESLQKAESLRQSILKKAFEGKLV